jgi:putative oxygen-independent coproporphyrinogen III oxidase
MILATTQTVSAAYLHIPFCRRRCYYCDFPVYVVGDKRSGENSQMVQTYVEVICQEITNSHNYGQPLDTIFFGGGTPSLLTPPQLEKILQTLARSIGISPSAEISMEIDPGTFTLDQLQSYLAAGVNRISMGVQAWQDPLLQVCGRSHNLADIERSIELIHQSSVKNWSLDLISGLPDQTMIMWLESLDRSIAAQPTHISVYDLIVEAQTPFAKQYQPSEYPLPSDTITADMYRTAQQILTTAGYDHYEISNYAKPGLACQHNQVYWKNKPYYAFGMGAASYLDGTRFTRPRYTQDYFQWVAAGGNYEPELLGKTERFLDTMMLGLRLATGLPIQTLIDEFGLELWQAAWSKLRRYAPDWVIVDHPTPDIPDRGSIRLSDPSGFLYSNTVLAALFEIGLETEINADDR